MKRFSSCLIAGVATLAVIGVQNSIVKATKVVKATKARGNNTK
jgi:hypothetical protein